MKKAKLLPFPSTIEPVDTVALDAAMDTIITSNVFISSGGDYVSKKGARVVERNVTDIVMA
jgi:hypothetical protein